MSLFEKLFLNKIIRIIFPNPKRDFRGKRWLKILLRTLHLIGIAGVGGGILLNIEPTLWSIYLQLTIFSGCAYLLLEFWTNGIFLLQLRGLSILLKLGLLYGMYIWPDYAITILILIIIISSVISHAPGNLRYYSIFHRRRVDTL